MKPESKIKVLAELDGFERCPSTSCDFRKVEHWHKNGVVYLDDNISVHMLPKYLTSYQAIIPLIQKQPKEIRWRMFVEYRSPNNGENQLDRLSSLVFMNSPEQLSDALIHATGKWQEE